MLSKLKKILRWPLAADDTHVYGGIALISAGAGLNWGWQYGVIALGAFLFILPIVLPLLGRKANNVTR